MAFGACEGSPVPHQSILQQEIEEQCLSLGPLAGIGCETRSRIPALAEGVNTSGNPAKGPGEKRGPERRKVQGKGGSQGHAEEAAAHQLDYRTFVPPQPKETPSHSYLQYFLPHYIGGTMKEAKLFAERGREVVWVLQEPDHLL
jgi:hypothetical protein